MKPLAWSLSRVLATLFHSSICSCRGLMRQSRNTLKAHTHAHTPHTVKAVPFADKNKDHTTQIELKMKAGLNLWGMNADVCVGIISRVISCSGFFLTEPMHVQKSKDLIFLSMQIRFKCAYSIRSMHEPLCLVGARSPVNRCMEIIPRTSKKLGFTNNLTQAYVFSFLNEEDDS